MANLSTNLSILRRRAGYTQEGLAEALGVSRQAVGKWESGQAMPEAATLLTLADTLDCTLDQLMREELSDGPAQAQAVPEPPEEEQIAGENDAYALFELYNAHMDRFSMQMSAGTALILMGAAWLLAFSALFGHSAVMVLPFFAALAAAVFLFISAGLGHEEFQRQYPRIPDYFLPEEIARFRRSFRFGIAGAVAAALLAVALFTGAADLFGGDDVMMGLSTSAFLFVIALAVGAIVRLGILNDKFDLEKYAKEAAKQK